jgi:hypothetical protein
LVVSRGTLVTVSALTLGDLVLWHWSLAGNHDVLALISGLSLPPLVVASAWLLAVTLLRVLARGAVWPVARVSRLRAGRLAAASRETAPVGVSSEAPQPVSRAADLRPAEVRPPEVGGSVGGRDGSTRKIAA